MHGNAEDGDARVMQARAKYTNAQQAEGLRILAECKGNLSAASRRAGVPRKTLGYWAEHVGVRGVVQTPAGGVVRRSGNADDQRFAKAEWENALRLTAAALGDPAKIAAANLQQLAVAAGISFDKLRLLQNASTANLALGASVTLADFLREAMTQQPAIEATIRETE